MYAFIRGIVDEVRETAAVIDAGGVGYLLTAPTSTLARLKKGEQAKLHACLCVREDDMTLFGFYTIEEKNMFEKLRAVSGIGPKLALAALSAMPVTQLTIALATGDVNALVRVPGLGKKTAQRLILELKEKIDQSQLEHAAMGGAAAMPSPETPQAQAISALTTLGYPQADAAAAVKAVAGQSTQVEQLVLLALQQIDAGRR